MIGADYVFRNNHKIEDQPISSYIGGVRLYY